MRINNFFKLIIAIAVSEVAGIIGAFFTTPSIDGWYAGIVKPVLNPPAWIFGPVWTTLFALMGISLFLIWSSYTKASEDKKKGIKVALVLFGIQLVLNTLWSIIFFGLHSPGGALIEIVFLWLAIFATIIAFAKISPPSSSIWTTAGHGKLAAWLLVPYILWVSFAMYLNYAIWSLN
ncbi:MAG: TspO/MBR family protein [Patescibacteria group bacterium]